MKRHVEIYMSALGYCIDDMIPCELRGIRANDIHHIDARGSGGDPTGNKDIIENLMAINRDDHNRYGDRPNYMFYLTEKHFIFLRRHGVDPDPEKCVWLSPSERLRLSS